MNLSVKELLAGRDKMLVIGPVLALGAGFLVFLGDGDWAKSVTLGVTLLTVCWWIAEPIPIPATSLIPIALLPLLGVVSQTKASQAFGSSTLLLLLGGFILSIAMSESGVHRRIALSMVRLFGGSSSRRLVFGCMTASAVLSMWISNTATTLMLLPVALAVLEPAEDPKLKIPLLLGIAYGASLGGIGTPIGTPPNLVFMQIYAQHTGTEVSFVEWMAWGVPVVVVFLPVMVGVLVITTISVIAFG